jgi:5'-nucleotidase
VLSEGLPKGTCLNVNFPLLESGAYKGVKVCRMSAGTWLNETTCCHHPRGYDYWWMVGRYRNDEPEAEDTDRWALDHGYVAVTPTTIDVTSYEALKSMKEWEE